MKKFTVVSGDVLMEVDAFDNKAAAISFINSSRNKNLGQLVCVDDGLEPVYFSTENLLNESRLRVV